MLAEPYDLVDAASRPASFSFDAKSIPCTTFRFSFPWRNNVATGSLKRQRSVADVDGEESSCTQKKKRRLRLNLVTSRLSQPYATPTTYIVSRGSIRGPKQLKPKAAGRSLLRRAAIINCMRRRKSRSQGQVQAATQMRLEEENPSYDDEDLQMIEDESTNRRLFKFPEPNLAHMPHKPSPLGLSNYDAIDLEGDPYDDEWDDDSGDAVNSDFKKRDPIDTAIADVEPYSSLQFEAEAAANIDPLSKDIMELVTDDDKQQEISFAQF